MTEKKEFLIPKNVEEGVKLFGDIKARELIKVLAPSLLLSAGIFYAPINPFIKLGIAGALILIPGYLIADRPIRKNIPVLYHMKTWIRYGLRQKNFTYKKEGYNVQAVHKLENEGTKTKANRTASHSLKICTRESINYTNKQISKTS